MYLMLSCAVMGYNWFHCLSATVRQYISFPCSSGERDADPFHWDTAIDGTFSGNIWKLTDQNLN